jgi:N utilization substance protein B
MSERYRPHVEHILSLVEENLTAIDELLEQTMPNWKLGRLAAIDRNVLRIGIAELLYADEIPPKVAIHEAIRLAGRYGSEESTRFVNGVLDAVHRKVAV